MVYIALLNNKIIHVCETDKKESVIKSMAYEGLKEYDEIRHIPYDYFDGKVGEDMKLFNADHTRRLTVDSDSKL